jgi:hypothetical protein
MTQSNSNTMQFHSGVMGSATINGVELPILSWKVQPRADIVSFKNSKTGAYPQREATFKDARVELALDLDFDNYPFASSPGVVIGAAISEVKLYLHGASGDYWLFPSMIVESNPMDVVIDGKIATSFTALPNGSFSYPTGITP